MATLTLLASFNQTDGLYPQCTLLVDAKGDLLGTTPYGGANGNGVVFEIANNGTVAAPKYASVPTTLISFVYSTNGQNPEAGLIADANGNLFGTTYGGSGNGVDATVFEIANNGSVAAPNYASAPTTLVNFNPNVGGEVAAGLIADGKGDLFGTTVYGMFEIKNNGAIAAPSYASAPTTFVTIGGYPYSGLLAANGDLFGTTNYGGANKYGSVFEITNIGTVAAPSYAVTTLASFNGGDGEYPYGTLIADAKGDLLGTTWDGGASGDGTAFEIVNNGSLAAPSYASAPITLVTFSGANGAQPEGALIADAKGDLFGTTCYGGANGGDGTVFEIKNNGTVAAPSYASAATTVFTFYGSDGAQPEAGLVADAKGDLFGTTAYGGVNGEGTVFEITNSGFAPLPLGPVLSGGASGSVTEGGAVALGATVTARYMYETLGNVTITGLPANLSGFNGGTYTASSGKWVGAAAQFNALTFTTAKVGTSTLSISATTTDSSTPATEAYTLTVDQAAPALGGATSATVAEGGVVTLGATDTAAFSDDTLGNVTITGLPTNLTGFNGGSYTASSGTWVGAAAQFNALSFDAGQTTGAFNLSISATTTGTDAGSAANESYTLTVDQAAPLLGGAASATVIEGDAVTLGATDTAAFSDDTMGDVTITGLPTDLTGFNGGTYTASTGAWVGTAAQFNALSFDAGQTTGAFHLSISAATTGAYVGAPATESYTLTVHPSPLTTLVSFNGGDGANPPDANLIADANGDLFGTTVYGGGPNDDGTVFEIANNGSVAAPNYASTPTTLVSFNGNNGANPYAGLIADAKGDLFGTTCGIYGSGEANSDGTVFEIVNNGSIAAPSYSGAPTTLVSFNGSDGESPYAGLIADAKGDLFGTTLYGGANDYGAVFEIMNNGSVSAPSYSGGPTTLASFNYSDGEFPTAGRNYPPPLIVA